jgi:hypothetical protein
MILNDSNLMQSNLMILNDSNLMQSNLLLFFIPPLFLYFFEMENAIHIKDTYKTKDFQIQERFIKDVERILIPHGMILDR